MFGTLNHLPATAQFNIGLTANIDELIATEYYMLLLYPSINAPFPLSPLKNYFVITTRRPLIFSLPSQKSLMLAGSILCSSFNIFAARDFRVSFSATATAACMIIGPVSVPSSIK